MDILEKYILNEYRVTAILPARQKTRVEVFFDFEIPIHRIPEWMTKWDLDPKLGGNKWGRIQGNRKGFWFEVGSKAEREKIIRNISKLEKVKGVSMRAHHVD